MAKKKPEMLQVYNSSNEFIFGEKGGRGKNLLTFLRNLSLTHAPASDINNSTIYGSLSYNSNNPDSRPSRSPPKRLLSGPIGSGSIGPLGSGSVGITPTTSHHSPTRGRRLASAKYTDLDDDWDATVSEELDFSKNTTKGFGNTVAQPAPMLDSLYPDLTIPVETVKKELIDIEDLKAKKEITKLNQLNTKYEKLRKVLIESSNINIQELRKITWNGVPSNLRAISWQILIGYLPTNKSRQSSTLKIKRQEYFDGIASIEKNINFDDSNPNITNESSASINLNREKQLYHQIKIDVKRTNPTIELYGHPAIQKSLRKILYFWSIRHPASGYVQGINDLVTPFFQTFLANYLWQLQRTKVYSRTKDPQDDDSALFIPGVLDSHDPLLEDPQLLRYDLHRLDLSKLTDATLAILEADSYWCLTRLLETITDNYIHEQPGILKQVSDLKNLISKIDIELINHFNNEGIEFIQFSFRWMNCLLMRELSIELVIRMWDTYLSENPLGFSNFHVYVCAAFLIKFSPELKQKDFQEILLFLQNPPTANWTEKDIELMLSEAFIWQSLYKNASAHLK